MLGFDYGRDDEQAILFDLHPRKRRLVCSRHMPCNGCRRRDGGCTQCISPFQRNPRRIGARKDERMSMTMNDCTQWRQRRASKRARQSGEDGEERADCSRQRKVRAPHWGGGEGEQPNPAQPRAWHWHGVGDGRWKQDDEEQPKYLLHAPGAQHKYRYRPWSLIPAVSSERGATALSATHWEATWCTLLAGDQALGHAGEGGGAGGEPHTRPLLY